MARYEELVARLRQDGHPTRHLALEVVARVLVSTWAFDAVKQLGLKWMASSRAPRKIGEVGTLQVLKHSKRPIRKCIRWFSRQDPSRKDPAMQFMKVS